MELNQENIRTAIDVMVGQINRQTADILSEMDPLSIPPLILLGRPTSSYLAAVEHAANRFGIVTIRLNRENDIRKEMAQTVANMEDAGCEYDVIWDNEDEETSVLYAEYCHRDLDRVFSKTPGTSCTANAIQLVLFATDMEQMHVAIIGRGHAVKGLPHLLLQNEATITQCHRKTKNIPAATYAANVVVNTAHPKAPLCSLKGKLILDVSGTLEEGTAHARLVAATYGEKLPAYVDKHQIGRLTVAILFNRYAREE